MSLSQATTVTLSAPDVSCAHCEHAITGALGAVPGVDAVTVDIPAKTVHVAFDQDRVRLDEIQRILADEGYPATPVTPANA
jgi:copper chaperone CopZ